MQTVIAIDLGGTKLSAAILDAQGETLQTLTRPTDKSGRAALLRQLAAVIDELRPGREVIALGIGTPGFVDAQQGEVLMATNLPGWSGTPVRANLEAMTGLPTIVENDANAAALGEAWLGAGNGRRSFVMLTLGTGVGGAIFDRQCGLWKGASHRSGEFGHSILYPGGRPCACGQRGCVDQYLSGRAIEAAYQEQTGERLPGESIFALARSGNGHALQVVERFARDLAVLLVSLQSTLDPEVFILGGGLLAARDVWGRRLDDHLTAVAMTGSNIQWLPAETGGQAGLLGAGKLAWERWRRCHA